MNKQIIIGDIATLKTGDKIQILDDYHPYYCGMNKEESKGTIVSITTDITDGYKDEYYIVYFPSIDKEVWVAIHECELRKE